ncbi:MAG: kelch repeat-containing protein, partial [Pseudomonadota bacterium]
SAQVYHTATKLTDGKVLVTGGHTFAAVATTHLYDPVANTWTSGAALTSTRESHTATLLGNGKVLICGGGNTAMLATTELYW